MKKTVQVVLLKDVAGTGKAGAVVDVAQAYAHNALLPKKLAALATRDVLAKLKQTQAQEQKRGEEQKKALDALIAKLSGAIITIHAKANGKGALYGSIGSREIVQELHRAGFMSVTEAMLKKVSAMTTLGTHSVTATIDGREASFSVVLENKE